MISWSRRVGVLLVGGVVFAEALGGCSSNKPDDASPSSPVSVRTSSTPSPSVSLSSEDQAQADAEEAVQEYFRVWNKAQQDPVGYDWDRLKTVATDTALSDLQSSLASSIDQNAHAVGDLKVEWIKVAPNGVDLTDNQTITPPDVPHVQLRVCYDVSAVDVVTNDGTSVVQPGRKDRAVLQVGVSNYEYPQGSWRVAWTQQTEETC